MLLYNKEKTMNRYCTPFFLVFVALLTFANQSTAQNIAERKIIITDVNETEVIRKDTTVSIHANVDHVLTQMGYDPLTIALASGTKVGRKITIETTEVSVRDANLQVNNTPSFSGRTSEEIMELLDMVNEEAFYIDSSQLNVITEVLPEIILSPAKSHTFSYGIEDFQDEFPILKVTVAELDPDQLIALKLIRDTKEDVLNISNFRVKPDYTQDKYRLSFNHFGAGKTYMRIYDSKDLSLLYDEFLPGNHFDYLIDFMKIDTKKRFVVVCERNDQFFARSVELH